MPDSAPHLLVEKRDGILILVMNRPGKRHGNWAWKLERGQLTDELARRLYESTEASKRRPASTWRRPPRS